MVEGSIFYLAYIYLTTLFSLGMMSMMVMNERALIRAAISGHRWQ